MKNLPEALKEIYGFRTINERLGTAGQPTESQFKLIQQAGYEAVINLALTTSDNALLEVEDEAGAGSRTLSDSLI